MKEAMTETEKEMRKGKTEKRGWWNEECGEEKRKMRRELRK